MRNRRELQAKIVHRELDDRWQVVTPASLVRMGLTDRELVRQGKAVDLTQWVTVYVTKTELQAKKWLDRNKEEVLKLGIPYEVVI